MWKEKNFHFKYVKNILATDVTSALFLDAFMKKNLLSKKYLENLEVADLNSYKLITKWQKVRKSLQVDGRTPFVFFIGKN